MALPLSLNGKRSLTVSGKKTYLYSYSVQEQEVCAFFLFSRFMKVWFTAIDVVLYCMSYITLSGLGINLTSADTVILHDVDFNPEVRERERLLIVFVLNLN